MPWIRLWLDPKATVKSIVQIGRCNLQPVTCNHIAMVRSFESDEVEQKNMSRFETLQPFKHKNSLALNSRGDKTSDRIEISDQKSVT